MFGVFCRVYMCVFVCTFVEEVSVDLLAATTPFVAPRSKIGKLWMQIRLIRGAKRSAEKFGFCAGVGISSIMRLFNPPKFYDPPPLYRKSASLTKAQFHQQGDGGCTALYTVDTVCCHGLHC